MVLRRNVLLAWSAGLVMSLSVLGLGRGLAQEAKVEAPKEEPKVEVKAEEPKVEAPKEEPKAAAEAPKAAETPADTAPPTIPPEVEAKLEAARKAVAEAIVAAQDAGLVDSSIDPPPILDILIQGYANDGKLLKNKDGKKPYAVSPEVLGAWFTGYGKVEGVDYVKDVRIVNPNAGLKAWYDQRAAILNRTIEAVRKEKAAAAPAEAPKEEPKVEAPKEEPKPEAPKEEPKAEEAKPEAPKAEEAKVEAPKEEPKAEEAKPEAPKAEEPKQD
ncbi:hypothetical protein [Planctomyces sp. SH-PL62]|uniref:hypothetical protein n=1 Tax=Planctomyces sp. SH-PL62 TaxID=1636152 RepID=UPI00078BE39F|nr:hypothetical protein [Planctomyces sp. SH-PL62]AMV40405.1 hypothetical protein VT85_23440 [Planctomyces sp. SH-PL62]